MPDMSKERVNAVASAIDPLILEFIDAYTQFDTSRERRALGAIAKAAIAVADATRPVPKVTPQEAMLACERLESIRELAENDFEEQDMKAVLEDFLDDREAALKVTE